MRQGTLDLVVSVTMLAIALFLLWESTDQRYVERVPGHAFGPMFYPRLMLAIWALLSVVLIVRGVMLLRTDAAVPRLQWGNLLAVLVITGVYMWLVTVLGFFFSSAAFMVGALVFLGFRHLLWLPVIAIGFPLVTWYVFQYLLRIPLPSSPWFGQI